MTKRTIVLLLLLSLPASIMWAQEIVFSFDSLLPDERLAYRMEGKEGWQLNLYAQDSQTLRVTRFVNAWDNSAQWGALQFANNRRDCIFVIQDKPTFRGAIYRLIGDEGVVIKLFDNRSTTYNFVVSHDGKFLLFKGYNDGNDYDEWGENECIFSLFDTGTGELLSRFSWTIKNPVGGFHLFRNPDGMFYLYYIGEDSYVYGGAKINPMTFEFEELWDRTENEGDVTFEPPKQTRTQFNDDIGSEFQDKTLNLEEAPAVQRRIPATMQIPQNDIDKTMYKSTSLGELFFREIPESTEYYQADARFRYLFLSSDGSDVFYTVESLDGNTGASFRGHFGLSQPEEGQIITAYFRLLSESEHPKRMVMDYIEVSEVQEQNNTAAEPDFESAAPAISEIDPVSEMTTDRRAASFLLWVIGCIVLFVGVIVFVIIKRKKMLNLTKQK